MMRFAGSNPRVVHNAATEAKITRVVPSGFTSILSHRNSTQRYKSNFPHHYYCLSLNQTKHLHHTVTQSANHMSQPSDIPGFYGVETPEDAEKWLDCFIACTGNFNDSGMFRLLRRKLPVGSPARRWFDTLEDTTKESWIAFEQEFCKQWLAINRPQEIQDAWEAFAHHTLTDDTIFTEEVVVDGCSYSGVVVWADEHLRLGKATNREDAVLVEMTKQVVPAFFQAFLEVNIKMAFPTFDHVCALIKNTPAWTLCLARAHRRITLADRGSAIERRIEELSEKVDRLLSALGPGPVLAGGIVSSSTDEGTNTEDTNAINNLSSNGSITQERSSPLTLVESVSLTRSESSTPMTRPVHLEATYFDTSLLYFSKKWFSLSSKNRSGLGGSIDAALEIQLRDDSSYHIPQEWRKPTTLRTRKELINIAQQAIDSFANYDNRRYMVQCQLYSYWSTLAIYDRLTQSNVSANRWLFGGSGNDDRYGELLDGISNLHSYSAHQAEDKLSDGVKIWLQIAGPTPGKTFSAMVRPGQNGFTLDNCAFEFPLATSGEPSIVGGVFDVTPLNWQDCNISSIRTVLFMILCSYLAESTGEGKYAESAVLSASFVRIWFLDPVVSLVKDNHINPVNHINSHFGGYSCHLTGMVIEGFSVLASVTHDDSWRLLAIHIATAAMRYSDWHNTEGVLIVEADGDQSKNTNAKAFKGLLNRGLMVAYEHNRSNELFCNMVRSYINVQFETLYNSSRRHNSYGIDWGGPYVGPYVHGQIAALDTIIAAIGVNEP